MVEGEDDWVDVLASALEHGHVPGRRQQGKDHGLSNRQKKRHHKEMIEGPQKMVKDSQRVIRSGQCT
jgi:hypothetical protein